MGTSCQGESPAGGSWVRGTGLLPSSGLGTGDRGHCRQPSTTTREPAAGVACSQGLSLRKTKCPHLWRGSGPSASGPWASGASLTDDTPPLPLGPRTGQMSFATYRNLLDGAAEREANHSSEKEALEPAEPGGRTRRHRHRSSGGSTLPRVWARHGLSQGPTNHRVRHFQTFSPCSHRGF